MPAAQQSGLAAGADPADARLALAFGIAVGAVGAPYLVGGTNSSVAEQFP